MEECNQGEKAGIADQEGRSKQGKLGQMPMTQWAIVCQAQKGTEASARDALSQLCKIYWYPLWAFARRWGCSPEDAEDVTQDFFLKLLSKNYLGNVSREKGRLRNFLLKAMKNHLYKWKRDAQAEKRGGGTKIISIDQEAAEQRYRLEPVDVLTPEVVFDRHWALTIMKHAREKLEDDYRNSGKAALFEELKGAVSTELEDSSYESIGGRLNMKTSAVKQAASRLKQRFKALLINEIAHTVETGDEVDDEIRYLLVVFRS